MTMVDMRTPLETVSRNSRSMINWPIVVQDTILMMSSIPRIIDKTCPQMVSIMAFLPTAPHQHGYFRDRTGTHIETCIPKIYINRVYLKINYSYSKNYIFV